MDTSATPDHPDICTVTEMARVLRLSRARFYQLLKQGVFPPPVYCRTTRKPVYTQQLQEVCLRIRKTGMDVNGQFVRFYAKRKNTHPAREHKQITGILRGMGLTVTTAQVRAAIRHLKLPKTDRESADSETIRTLFQYFYERRQNAV